MPTTGGYRCAGDIPRRRTLVTHDAGVFQTYRFVVDKHLGGQFMRKAAISTVETNLLEVLIIDD